MIADSLYKTAVEYYELAECIGKLRFKNGMAAITYHEAFDEAMRAMYKIAALEHISFDMVLENVRKLSKF